MEGSNKRWSWSKAGDMAGRSAVSQREVELRERAREWGTSPSSGGSTIRKMKLPMKLYLRTLTYINYSDPRFATPPFQIFMLQTCSFTTAAEVRSCLPVNTENQPGSVYQSTVTAPQMFAQCCLWISCQTISTHTSAWNKHHTFKGWNCI